jgi:hypothetical protein
MKRYVVGKFDDNTFVVINEVEKREICVCSNYDDWEDAEERAKKIVSLLNTSVSSNGKTLG